MAQSLLAAERSGVTIDVRDVLDEDFNETAARKAEDEPQGLPPLGEPKKVKMPRR